MCFARIGRALGLLAVLGLVGCGQREPAETQPTIDTVPVEPPAPQPVTISGVVESTDPDDFATRTTQRPGRNWPDLLFSPAYAQTTFVAVSGVPVRAYPITNTGYVYGPPIATTTTATAGDFALVMPTTYVYQPRTEYVVVAGGPVIEDRIDDWGDLGDSVLRRLVTGLVGQVISPVSEVVYRELIPVAQVQYIDVHTLPVVQVESYHTYVLNQVQVIDFSKQHGLRNAIAHLEQNLAKHQDRIAERDAIFVSVTRLSDEQRRDDEKNHKPKGNAGDNRGNDDKPKADSGPGHSDGGQGNDDRPKGNSGNDDKPKGNSGNDDKPKGNSGGGQSNDDKPKGNSGGGQGNDDRPKGNSGGGGQGNDDRPKGNSGGGQGSADKPKGNSGGDRGGNGSSSGGGGKGNGGGNGGGKH